MIVEPVISAAIINLIKGINSPEDPDTAIKQYADGMAKIIADAIKSGTVTTPAGVAVATAGSPSAQTGATTAPGIGTIS
jgi:hypothetical protein